jgi:transcriptional regulator with XRE-family HTH domain
MKNPDRKRKVLTAGAEDIPSVLRELRVARGLSQRELARRAQTKASVICRLEKPDYRGHSLEMLRRIGAILGVEIVVQFACREGPPPGANEVQVA